MTRSRLAYPLNRGADMDVGGAADLQTDVMRFMAILSLCLVAIFALVQSLPVLPPAEPAPNPDSVTETVVEQVARTPAVVKIAPEPAASTEIERTLKTVILTRPKPTSEYPPKTTLAVQPVAPTEPMTTIPEPLAAVPSEPEASVESAAPAIVETEGFTLRFESDAALTRLVAASQVGVYAIETGRARRMTVSNSRISFWDASIPNSFHEMEKSTVPKPVLDALAKTGADTGGVSWGVTLPGRLKKQLDGLMQEHRGGSLVIGASGDIRLEKS